MAADRTFSVALLWHGDREARDAASLDTNRLAATAEALRQVGIEVEPAVYADEFASEVREQLLRVDGVLVWVNPIEKGRDRTALDDMLREVADSGVMVSTHPDVVLRLGTKEVLYDTREMSWGGDTDLYRTAADFRARFPQRLAEGAVRVLKQYRGNGGNGVWKVHFPEPDGLPAADSPMRVRHAQRGSVEETMELGEFLDRCEPYFAGQGRLIDQAYQERLPDGMIRAYLVRDKVAGFGHQAINALYPAPPDAPASEAPPPGPRLYYPPTRPDCQHLRRKVDDEWVPALLELLGLKIDQLPVLWDLDFLLGPKDAEGQDTYVLCEINVSSVYPFPDSALEPLARETQRRLAAREATRRGTSGGR